MKSRRVMVDVNKIKPGPIRHPSFSSGHMLKIAEIKMHLDEVYPLPLEKWEDGFRRDLHMDREISFWLAMGRCYSKHATKYADDPVAKKEIFTLIIWFFHGCPGEAPQIDVLTEADGHEIAEDLKRELQSDLGRA